ncbi:hypothetical protein ADH76_00055 [Enterocloster clostridioformis]|nr:hypothetical protein A4V08_04335 [Lachnoclostridium sp. YL32]NDO27455.1 hypothetical protein [Enterocloster clostridioformis]OXE69919.1 hypothetical protein ADH76_00055 [Enterocloster clostridioformis]QQR00066.1 hypothetical protein I5Q83_30290 [Enterocloster clostridioformis]
MNELKNNGTQIFIGIEIPIIEGGFGENQKVIIAKTISEIHGQPLKNVTDNSYGKTITTYKPLITGKGQIYFTEKLIKGEVHE